MEMEQENPNKRKHDERTEQPLLQDNTDKGREDSPSTKKARVDLTLKPSKYEHLRQITKKLFNSKSLPDKQKELNNGNLSTSPDEEKQHDNENSREQVVATSKSCGDLEVTNPPAKNDLQNIAQDPHHALPPCSQALLPTEKVQKASLKLEKVIEKLNVIKSEETSIQDTLENQETEKSESQVQAACDSLDSQLQPAIDSLGSEVQSVSDSVEDNKVKRESDFFEGTNKQAVAIKEDISNHANKEKSYIDDLSPSRCKTRDLTKMLRVMIEERMSELKNKHLPSGIVAELSEKICLLEKVNKVLELRTASAKGELDKAMITLRELQKEKPRLVTRGTQTTLITVSQSQYTNIVHTQPVTIQSQSVNVPLTFVPRAPQQILPVQRQLSPHNQNNAYVRYQVIPPPRVTCTNSSIQRPAPPRIAPVSQEPRLEAPPTSVQVVFASRPPVMSSTANQSHITQTVSSTPQGQVACRHPSMLNSQPVGKHTNAAQPRPFSTTGASVRPGAPNTRVAPNQSVTRPYHPRESSFILNNGQLVQRHQNRQPLTAPNSASVNIPPRNAPQAHVEPLRAATNAQDVNKQYTSIGKAQPVTATVHPQPHYNQSVTQQPLRPPPPPYSESSQRMIASGMSAQQVHSVANQSQRRVLPADVNQGQVLVQVRSNIPVSSPPATAPSPSPSQVSGFNPTCGQVVGTVVPQVQTRNVQSTGQSAMNDQPRNVRVPPPPPPPRPSLPSVAHSSCSKAIEPQKTPPKPSVSIDGVQNGIVLSWNMDLDSSHARIDSYQLFAYQDTSAQPTSPSMWKKIGVVKALPLPMACTLTQFLPGSTYHFAVRAVDVNGRAGAFSDPCTITLPYKS